MIKRSLFWGGIAKESRNLRQVDEPVGSSGIEELEYVADLILQLKEIADKGGHATLSGILEIAYHEARVQVQFPLVACEADQNLD